MDDSNMTFFLPNVTTRLARPLAITVLWTFAAAISGGLIIGLASVIAGAITGLIWVFDRSMSVSGAMGETLRIAAWIFAPIGLVVAVWAAAYGTTKQGSIPRTLIAAPIAVGVAVATLFLGSSGLLAASLAIGWALAIPSGSLTQAAARGLPLLIVALIVPKLGDLSLTALIWMLVASPVFAAVGVYVANLPWALRSDPAKSD